MTGRSNLRRNGRDCLERKIFHTVSEKQARITNAALEVFARNDYKHASTDDIAAKAGISKGLLFYYFRNKQSLYLYLYDYALEQVRAGAAAEAGRRDGFFELMHIGAGPSWNC
ncbi:MAG: TetR/AcrR family transcriptional regulator [Ruthenibacterium lactatiformans]